MDTGNLETVIIMIWGRGGGRGGGGGGIFACVGIKAEYPDYTMIMTQTPSVRISLLKYSPEQALLSSSEAWPQICHHCSPGQSCSRPDETASSCARSRAWQQGSRGGPRRQLKGGVFSCLCWSVFVSYLPFFILGCVAKVT